MSYYGQPFVDRRRGDSYLARNDFDRDSQGATPALLRALASGMGALARKSSGRRVSAKKKTVKKTSRGKKASTKTKKKKSSTKSALSSSDRALLKAAAGGHYSMGMDDMSHSGNQMSNTLTVHPSQFLPTTADYMLAYGNPFISLDQLQVAVPRVPDQAFTGASAAVSYEITETINTSTAEFMIVKSSRFGGIAGMDIVGGEGFVWPNPADASGTPNPIEFSQGVTCFLNRQRQNPYAYGRFADIGTKTVAGRYVAAGMKIHDLGAVETSAGQIQTTHCGPQFMQGIMQAMQNDVNMNRLGLSYGPAVAFAQGSVPSGAAGTLAPTMGLTAWNRTLKGVADLHQYPQGNRWQEFVTADGTSARISTAGSLRPFAQLPPPLIFTPSSLTAVSVRGINRYASTIGYSGRNFYDEYVAPIVPEIALAYAIDANRAYGITWIPAAQAGLNFNIMQVEFSAEVGPPVVTAYSVYVLCDVNGIPLWCYQDVTTCGLDEQGDAPYMCSYVSGQSSAYPAVRPFKTYSATWEEIIPNQSSALTATPAPQDANWDDVSRITASFVTVTKGFSFFSKLIDGVGDALKFTVKTGSKIFGLGKTVAMIL